MSIWIILRECELDHIPLVKHGAHSLLSLTLRHRHFTTGREAFLGSFHLNPAVDSRASPTRLEARGPTFPHTLYTMRGRPYTGCSWVETWMAFRIYVGALRGGLDEFTPKCAAVQ